MKTEAKGDTVLNDIQKIVAAQLKQSQDEIRPNSTFASLGADDLDLVEITMAVEDQLGITIADDALIKAAGVSTADELVGHLTLTGFAAVAAAAPRQLKSRPADPGASDAGNLRDAQVGTFGALSKLPNPNNYVLVFVPSLDTLTAHQEQQLGRKMTEAELKALKEKGATIALPAKMAEEMKRKQNERQ